MNHITMSSRRRILDFAYHEAGHAVMARLLACRIGVVRLGPPGVNAVARHWATRTLTWQNRVLVAIAGRVAVALYRRGGEMEDVLSDMAEIGALLAEEYPDDELSQGAAFDMFADQAAIRLEQPKARAAFHALAERLARRGWSTGTEAERIIGRHLASPALRGGSRGSRMRHRAR